MQRDDRGQERWEALVDAGLIKDAAVYQLGDAVGPQGVDGCPREEEADFYRRIAGGPITVVKRAPDLHGKPPTPPLKIDGK
jgi:hypothetical protein